MKNMVFIDRLGNHKVFDTAKIHNAIVNAANACNVKLNVHKIVNSVVSSLSFGEKDIHLETVQNMIICALFEVDKKVALAYTQYRQEKNEMRDTLIDSGNCIEEYINKSDWRVQGNANQKFSLGGCILNTSGKVVANYWLDHVYSKGINRAHRAADFHIHDLDMLCGYCAGWSLRELLNSGFNGVAGTVSASPPKHLSSAIGQMINFLGSLQNEWAGAQSFSSFDTYLAPFVRADNLSYKEVKQEIQTFVYCCNATSRWGGQPVFSNITFDWSCPDDLKLQVPSIGGTSVAFTYGKLSKEIDMIGEAFYDVVLDGDMKGNPFTFPIPTINITKDFPWDSKKSDLMFKTSSKYGITYFQNFISSDLNPSHTRSMCCRLRLDLDELLKRGNGLFGSVEYTGSIGVVTINCARLGYLNKGNWGQLLTNLDNLLVLAKQSLETKRDTLNKLFDQGLYPHTRRFLPRKFLNHFSTIGVNGIHEMLLNFSNGKIGITDEVGVLKAIDLLHHIRAKLKDFQEETGNLYNLEATPAEGTTYRFAKEDQKRYTDIIQSGTTDAPYYTNSSQPPVDWTNDPFTLLNNQDDLQAAYTGGTVVHLYTADEMKFDQAKKMVKRVFENYNLPYLTITTVLSICDNCGYIPGEHEICPTCNEKAVVWTRVMGYHRPVSSFNKGKKSEHQERELLELNTAVEHFESNLVHKPYNVPTFDHEPSFIPVSTFVHVPKSGYQLGTDCSMLN